MKNKVVELMNKREKVKNNLAELMDKKEKVKNKKPETNEISRTHANVRLTSIGYNQM